MIQSLDNGGCENMLLRALPLVNSFEHLIITLNKKGELAEKFEKAGLRVLDIGQKNIFDFSAYHRLKNAIKNYNPDLIISYLFHADMIGRFFVQSSTRKKVIPFLRTTYNHPKYRIARLLEKLSKRMVEHYLANSESVKNYYAENIGVAPNKITVIPNGIDVTDYDRVSRDENLRTILEIKKDDIALICVANFHINKGHKYLLEAFENVYKNNNKIKLLLVGDGDERNNLLNQIKNYASEKNIIFLGKRSDVPQLLKISDIFVLPTLFEGMSNAIMEAMASGLPIITTDIPENTELLSNRTSGILIAPNNPKAIENAIKDITNNKKFKLFIRSNAKRFILERFSLETTASRLQKFYCSML